MFFTEKTIILTGASSGIGFELAKLIAKEKCNLVLLSRRKEITDKLAAELLFNGTGSNILSLKCDVTKKEEVQTVLETVKQKFGKIDVAILNHGVDSKNSLQNFNSKDAEYTFRVNVFGYFYFFEALLPDFKERDEGMIVGVTSLAEARGFSQSGIYCSSKAAASLLLESWRVQLRKYNVKVITVKPGFVKTPMTDKNKFPMPFLLPADKAAKIILKGIKKEKRIIQFPFPIVLGARIAKVLPNFIFDRLMKYLDT